MCLSATLTDRFSRPERLNGGLFPPLHSDDAYRYSADLRLLLRPRPYPLKGVLRLVAQGLHAAGIPWVRLYHATANASAPLDRMNFHLIAAQVDNSADGSVTNQPRLR